MQRSNFTQLPHFAALALAVLTIAAISNAPAAHAETEIYKDVLRPHGVARSEAAKLAQGRACGASADDKFTDVPAFDKCMRAHGWALDHIRPDASDTPGATFDDLRPTAGGQSRGNGALHADVKKCDPSGRMNEQSPAFKRCMLNSGWRLSFVIPEPKTKTSPTWIDPDTGLSCHSVGIGSICVPPQGTVTYFDSKHGLNCRRTGAVSVCSNL